MLPWLAGQAGAHKVGLLAYAVPQSADCADGTANSFEKYGSMTDSSVAFTDKSLAYGTADLSVQVSKMKDAGVDFVATCMDTNGVVTLAKEMKKQGLDAVQCCRTATTTSSSPSSATSSRARTCARTSPSSSSRTSPRACRTTSAAMDKSGKEPTENSTVGWLNANLFVEGLKAAGPNFSRQGLIDAINQMTDYNADGMLNGVDWTIAHTQEQSDHEVLPVLLEDRGQHVRRWPSANPGKPFVCAVVNGDTIDTEYQ